MRYIKFEEWSVVKKLFYFFFVSFASYMIIFVFGASLGTMFFNYTSENIFESLSSDSDVIRYFQGITTIGFFIVPALFILFISGNSIGKYFGLNRVPSGRKLIIAIILMPVAIFLIMMLAKINHYLPFPEWVYSSELRSAAITDNLLRTDSFTVLLANLFVIALLPAVGEELFFRGLIQKAIVNKTSNVHIGVIITAAIFSAVHFQFLGFIPRMLMGIILGYMFVWSKNIWYPIIAHFINNAIAVITIYYNPELSSSGSTELYSETTLFIAGIISAVIVYILLIMFFRISKQRKAESDSFKITG